MDNPVWRFKLMNAASSRNTCRIFFLLFCVIYIFDLNQMTHGQLHGFNVCLLFIHRIKLSSALNISRLSQQTPSPFAEDLLQMLMGINTRKFN
jgi:hypothetical protein